MSGKGAGAARWPAGLGHRLWLDGPRQTDSIEAGRGFTTSRKPVRRWFGIVVGAIGVGGALLILAARGTAAQPADEGQRLILEQPGFAVTLPADWRVELREPLEYEGDLVWAAAARGASQDEDQSCVFFTSGPRSSSVRFQADATDDPESGYAFAWLDLPAGRTLYFEDYGFRPHIVVEYRFPRGIQDYVMGCTAQDPPEDRWRSIAESFAFLDEVHHVRIPELGLAMTFPGDWTALEDHGPVAGAPGWEALLWASDSRSTCRLQHDTGHQSTGAPSADVTGDAYRAWLRRRSADVVGSVDVELPSGPARRTDWVVDWWDGRMPHSTYELEVADALLRLVCNASATPPDRWQSLLETIEVTAEPPSTDAATADTGVLAPAAVRSPTFATGS